MASLLENIINDKLYLTISHRISPKQHGFIAGRSVSTNLLQLSDLVTTAIGQNLQVDALYLDLAKAFDTVDHALLLDKLITFGVNGSLLRWFASYLSERNLSVNINGFQSESFIASSGVAQGSRLGSLLFAVFINDLVEVVQYSNIELFADDCRISKLVGCPQDAHDLQRDLDMVTDWIRNNRLFLNLSKCQKITFARSDRTLPTCYYIDRKPIQEVNCIRDLGVLLDNNWSFHSHMQHVLSKSSRTLGFIKRLTAKFTSLDTVVYLFKALVLPTLTYSSIIWSPYSQNKFDDLNNVIRKFLRYASLKTTNPMLFYDHDYSDISQLCQIYMIESLHEYRDLCFVSEYIRGKLMSESLDCNFVERNLTYNLRFSRQFLEHTHKNNYIYYAPIFRIIRCWNMLAGPIRNHLLDSGSRELLKKEVLKLF